MSCVRENSPPLESELDASCAGGPLSLPAGRAHPHTHGATSTPISSPGNDAHQSPTAGELSNCFHNTTNETSWAAAEQINKHMPYSYSCQGISRWAALLNHSSAECGIMKLPWGLCSRFQGIAYSIEDFSFTCSSFRENPPRTRVAKKVLADCQRLGVWFDCHPRGLIAVWQVLAMALCMLYGLWISVDLVGNMSTYSTPWKVINRVLGKEKIPLL